MVCEGGKTSLDGGDGGGVSDPPDGGEIEHNTLGEGASSNTLTAVNDDHNASVTNTSFVTPSSHPPPVRPRTSINKNNDKVKLNCTFQVPDLDLTNTVTDHTAASPSISSVSYKLSSVIKRKYSEGVSISSSSGVAFESTYDTTSSSSCPHTPATLESKPTPFHVDPPNDISKSNCIACDKLCDRKCLGSYSLSSISMPKSISNSVTLSSPVDATTAAASMVSNLLPKVAKTINPITTLNLSPVSTLESSYNSSSSVSLNTTTTTTTTTEPSPQGTTKQVVVASHKSVPTCCLWVTPSSIDYEAPQQELQIAWKLSASTESSNDWLGLYRAG